MARRPSPQTVAVVGALLQDPDRWHYGYELSKQLGLPSGTLYPILMRLSERDQLETRWEEPSPPGRPARHLYRLTEGGRTWARAAVAAARQRPVRSTRPALEPG